MDLADDLITDPYGTYATLRTASPVHRIKGTDGQPAWIVTRYEDVRAGLADPRLSLDKKNALPGNYHGSRLPPALDANLLNMDPPDHTRIRRLVGKAFTPGRVERLRAPVRALADQLLDALGQQGSTDLIAAYAAPLPISVICELLGVAPDRRGDFRGWAQALLVPDPDRPQDGAKAVGAMLAYFVELIEHKRREPKDDLLSDLIAVHDAEDGRLSEDELLSLAFLILVAGFENTVQLIGNAVLALLRHPDQLDELRADSTRIPAAVEEVARYEGPALLAIRRFPTEDMEIGGVPVKAGETVLLSLAAADRDPDRFPDPDRLDLARDTAGHLALGHGIHYCLGAPLARAETEIALRALLERFPRLELDADTEDPAPWRRSLRARGLDRLMVRYDAASASDVDRVSRRCPSPERR
ncbi:cytochrome P450 [Streptomyces sp. NPDC046939]|uniref:cytochrome P450 family protein n=1 Tax=Streptomyces sp. NPDC046939 TaxID=3155376 RepID=UPI0033DCEDF9